jgi:hypothetical protein
VNTNYRHKWIAGVTLAGMLLSVAHAAEPKLPRDGWASWEIPAVDHAPAWCCCANGGPTDSAAVPCRLDDRHDGWNIRNRDATTAAVKVYVRTQGGKVDRLQVLSADCPVETATPVETLHDVSPDDSVHWLVSQVRSSAEDALTHRPLGESALAALALHPGDLARDSLARFSRDPDVETRKWSVFWLALLRGAEGAEITSSVMFDDADPRVREHAAFALSQSHAPRVATDLVRLGNTDKSGEVRAKAWFWLAHTGAAQSEAAIGAALRQDADASVREQAIFALSQLPGDRASRALITAAEDRALPREIRKRAVFWLSQSNSDAAQAYLEKVLATR